MDAEHSKAKNKPVRDRSVLETLAESEQRFREIFANIPSGILLIDVTPEGDFIVAGINPTVEKNTNLVNRDIAGKLIADVFSSEACEYLTANFRLCMKAGSPITFEEDLNLPIRRGYFNTTLIPVHNKTGQIYRIIEFSFDITEGKKAELQLQLEHRRNCALLELVEMHDLPMEDVLYYALNKSVALTHSKIGYIFLYDEEKRELTNFSWSRNVLDECQVKKRKSIFPLGETGLWGEAIRQRKPIITNDYREPNLYKRGIPPGHIEIIRHLNVPVFEGNKIVALVGVGNKETYYNESDIQHLILLMDSVWRNKLRRDHIEELGSARKRAEAELVSLNRDFINLMENTPDFIYIKDNEYRFTAVSNSFARIAGYDDPRELLGKTDFHIFPREHAIIYKQSDELVLQEGREMIDIEEPYYGTDGSLRWILANKKPVYGPSGQIIGLFGIDRDITERKQMMQKLEDAKDMAIAANKAKSAFLANISHEIRTPMNAILGFSQLMLRSQDLTPEQRQQMQTINRSGEHLLAIINDILELSKIEAGRVTINPTTFDLYALFKDLENMFFVRTFQKNIKLEIKIAEDVPQYIVTDEKKLRQILINLLGNAVKFTKQGGIVVRAGIKKVNKKMHLQVEVEDSGCGVPNEDMERIFEIFEQTLVGLNEEGTGMGLAISRNFARIMGGDITVTSEVGVGSCFNMEIDITPGSKDKIKDKGSHRQVIGIKPGQGPYRVLVVDDNEDNRLFLSELLREVGFLTYEAENGHQAIEAFEKWAPHLIMMDIYMPIIDGHEATRYIKSLAKEFNTRIIAITASAFDEDRAQAMESGADGYLCKPLQENEILEMIASCLGVDYVYKTEINTNFLNKEKGVTFLEPQELTNLPAELMNRIYEAADSADYYGLMELLNELTGEAPLFAAELKELARNFNFEKILELFADKEI